MSPDFFLHQVLTDSSVIGYSQFIDTQRADHNMNWHKEYFIDMARIAHYTGMRRRKAGRVEDACVSFAERKLYLKLARGD